MTRFDTMKLQRRQLLIYTLFGLLPFKVRAACRITEPNSLGPFYRRDAPFRNVIATADERGQPLHVYGKVLGSDGCTPLARAIVDVWHANQEGRYYDVGASAGSLPDTFRLRGRIHTNAQGEYDFRTILPGTYGGRPKHIHYVVYHPDAKPLVTQLYFAGDPFLESDWIARDSLVRPLEGAGDDNLETSFDIVLKT